MQEVILSIIFGGKELVAGLQRRPTVSENREVLSVLPVCGAQSPESTWAGLSVSGLVARPRNLDSDGLSRLAQGEMVDDFRCVSGWVAPDQRWEGVPVSALLDDAAPLPEAQYVGFTSGGYTVGMPMAEAREAGLLVALRHNDAPLTAEHGGPCRLVVQGRAGRWSVKWLERIELLAELPEDTGHHQH